MTIHVIYCEFEQEYINSQCQLLKLTFTFEKTGCVTTVHGEELFVPIVLISSHPFPCHAHLVGRSLHLAHLYIAISCKVGFWSLFVLPPLPWGWSCSSHTPPSCDESLPAPPSRFDPPAKTSFKTEIICDFLFQKDFTIIRSCWCWCEN